MTSGHQEDWTRSPVWWAIFAEHRHWSVWTRRWLEGFALIWLTNHGAQCAFSILGQWKWEMIRTRDPTHYFRRSECLFPNNENQRGLSVFISRFSSEVWALLFVVAWGRTALQSGRRADSCPPFLAVIPTKSFRSVFSERILSKHQSHQHILLKVNADGGLDLSGRSLFCMFMQ